MNKMYKYSFIIPHKNCPKLLWRCIQSIPERADVQIIVVDDNSDPEIVDFTKFPGQNRSNVNIVLTKEGRGAGYARNVGLNKASGQWVLFADADDYYEDGFLAVLDRELNNEEILYFNVKASLSDVDCRGNRIHTYYDELFWNAKEQIRFRFWAPWNMVFNLGWIRDKGFLFEETPIVNDAIFCLSASKEAKRYKIINDSLYVLTDQPGSITYRQRSFERSLIVLRQDLKINKLLKVNNINYVRASTISFLSLIRSIKLFGWKKTRAILNEVKQYNPICRELIEATIYNIKNKR